MSLECWALTASQLSAQMLLNLAQKERPEQHACMVLMIKAEGMLE